MKRFALLLVIFSSPLSSSAADAKAPAAAMALFQQHCASAGERIHNTVKDVDGVLLLKLRPAALNFGNQFLLDDPYGREYLGQGYIESFLHAHHELPGEIARLQGRVVSAPEQIGYAFVQADNPSDGKRHRYTAIIDQPGKTDPRYVIDYARVVLTSSPSTGPSPRYGITGVAGPLGAGGRSPTGLSAWPGR